MSANSSTLDGQPAAAPTPAIHAAPSPGRVRIAMWDLPLRLFHWSLVAAVSTAIVTGQLGGDWMRLHGRAGQAIIGLVVFRLVWGFVGSTHARFAHFLPTPSTITAYLRGQWRGIGHNPIGALSVLALLGVLAAQGLIGLFTNDDIAFTGPLAQRISEDLSHRLTGWHHLLGDGLLILLAVHVLAIVFYAVVKKDNLVGPMLTGHKEVTPQHARPEPASGRRGGRLALAVAVVAAISAVALASGVLLPESAPEAAAVAQPPAAAGW